jgi:polysaccharide pyruvyl transferase WcaK-like protein
MLSKPESNNERSIVQIFIAENVPSLNKGEETILGGMLESFKALGEAEVSMFSAYPEIDAPRYNSRVKVMDVRKFAFLARGAPSNRLIQIIISFLIIIQHVAFALLYVAFGSSALRFVKSPIWAHYVQSDAVIIGHDGGFGIGGGLGSPILFYPIFAPFFFKALGKCVVLYGGDIHRYNGRFDKLFGNMFRLALDRMDLITVRDPCSYQRLKALNVVNPNVHITSDLAFLLQPTSLERVAEITLLELLKTGEGKLIGMTVTREIASSAFAPVDPLTSYKRHVREMVKVVDFLTDSWGATVVFIPHCIGVDDSLDDRIVAKDIQASCKNKDQVRVITREYNAAELKGLLGLFDLFIGERLHSVINAMAMHVPSIFISNAFDERSYILKMAGQQDAFFVVNNLEAAELIKRIQKTWAMRAHIRAQLHHQMSVTRERALSNGLLLNELLSSPLCAKRNKQQRD